MVLKRLLLTPTRTTYKDVYQRSYTINADGSTLNMLEATFAANGVHQNNTINEVMIASALPGIVGLDPNTEGVATIPNGWRTERLRFILEIESELNGVLLSSYFQGYTEHSDMTNSGLHDPNMPFYINSVTNVTKTLDPVTKQLIVRPTSVYNVITDQFGGKKFSEIFENGDEHRLIRPLDIVNNMDVSSMYGDVTENINSLVGGLTHKIQTSKRGNNNGVSYFTNTVNAFIEGKSMSSLSSDSGDVLKISSTMLSESSLNSLEFIHRLHNLTGEVTPTTFTLGMIEILFPNSSNLIFRTQGDTLITANPIYDSNETEELYKANIETMIATNIVHSINGIMSDNLLSVISLTASNTTGVDFVEVIAPPQSIITGLDTTRYENTLKAKVKHVLMPEITRNGLLVVTFTILSDLLGDTLVTVSVNGGPMVPYRLPTFADSLYSPVVTTSSKAASLTDDLSNVLDTTYGGNQEPTIVI